MSPEHTTAAVQRYLNALAGDPPAEPVVRALLDRSVRRLQLLCGNLLYREYRRLTQPPLNLQPDEMLGAVVERLLKAVPEARPRTVRQFFGLVNQPQDFGSKIRHLVAIVGVNSSLLRAETALFQRELDDGFAQRHVFHDLDHGRDVIHLARFVRVHTDIGS